MTTTEIKASFNTNIRTKTADESITPDHVADELDKIVDFANDTLGGAFTTLTDGPVIIWAYTTAQKKKVVTLAGNRTLLITGTTDGDEGTLKVIQDGTGSRTLALTGETPTGYALSTGAAHVDVLKFTNIDGVLYWRIDNYGAVAALDTTPPSLIATDPIEALDANTIQVSYDEPIDIHSATNTDFILKVDGVVTPIEELQIPFTGTQVWVVTGAVTLTSAQVFTLSYTGGPTKITDLAGNIAASYTDHAVLNSI